MSRFIGNSPVPANFRAWLLQGTSVGIISVCYALNGYQLFSGKMTLKRALFPRDGGKTA